MIPSDLVPKSINFNEIGYKWLFNKKWEENILTEEELQKIIKDNSQKNKKLLRNYNGPPEGIVSFLNNNIIEELVTEQPVHEPLVTEQPVHEPPVSEPPTLIPELLEYIPHITDQVETPRQVNFKNIFSFFKCFKLK